VKTKNETVIEANAWKLPKIGPSNKNVYVRGTSQFSPHALSFLVTPLPPIIIVSEVNCD
jgi:hypothetical protein